MVFYKCPRCGFDTNHKAVFKKHLTRKNTCQSNYSNISIKKIVKMFSLNLDIISKDLSKKGKKYNKNCKCKYCDKLFSSRQSRSRHELKYCNIEQTSKNIIDKLNKKVSQLEKANLQSSNKISDTKTQNTETKLPYNKSDHKFISDSNISECMTKQYMSIPHLIKMVHFDPKHPENHNIYVSNIQSKHLFLYDGTKWVIKDKNEMIENLISSTEYKLQETLGRWIKDESNKDKYSFAIEKFKKYLEMKDNDKITDNIKEEIKLMLYNNRELCKDFYVHIKK
jgi:hypothetical protein